MSHEVRLMPQARKDLDDFRGRQLARFENLIMGLYEEPRPHNSRKLSGGRLQMENTVWRLQDSVRD